MAKSTKLSDAQAEAIREALATHYDHWGGTTRQLAHELGVSQTTVARTLRVDRVKASSYQAMFDFFGLTLEGILSGDVPEPTRVHDPAASQSITRGPGAGARPPVQRARATRTPARSPAASAGPPHAAAASPAPREGQAAVYTRDVVFGRVHDELGRYSPQVLASLGLTDALLAPFARARPTQTPGQREALAQALGTSLARIDALIEADDLGPAAYGHVREDLLGFMDRYDVSIEDVCDDFGVTVDETMRMFLLDLPERELFDRVFMSLDTNVDDVLASLDPRPVESPALVSAPSPATDDGATASDELATRATAGMNLRARMDALGLGVEALAAAGGVSTRYIDEVLLGVASRQQMYDDVGLLLGHLERDAARGTRRPHAIDPALDGVSAGTRDMLDELVRRSGRPLEELLRAFAIGSLTDTERGHDMYMTRAGGELLRAPAGTPVEVFDPESGVWSAYTRV
jgi:transcriptional regulator with XRE-family HTH domain